MHAYINNSPKPRTNQRLACCRTLGIPLLLVGRETKAAPCILGDLGGWGLHQQSQLSTTANYCKVSDTIQSDSTQTFVMQFYQMYDRAILEAHLT
jgi:hypothetical protein